MVNAVGSSTLPYSTSAGKSTSSLEVQLDRYQKELSNCISCSSSKTAEGKQNIQLISGKISGLQARIEEITATKLNAQKIKSQPTTPNVKTPANIAVNKDKFAPEIYRNVADVPPPSTGSTTTAVGNHLNIFA